MTRSENPLCSWSTRRIAWSLGALAGLAVVLTLGDPGITVDEPLDVGPGRNYVKTLMAEGFRFFSPRVVEAVYRTNAEHPPLGRWLLGLASTLGEPFEVMVEGADPLGLYLHAGRLAPAFAFAALVGLAASSAGRRYGRGAGAVAGFSLLVMPRVFAHAHFGALDTFVALFWTWALLRADRAIESSRPHRAMIGAGACWGLALLTKIHAWLLPPIVLAWAFRWMRPLRALTATAVWAATGLIVFIVGWPWLWYDSWNRLAAFLSTSVHRTPIRVLYFGQLYIDRDVPWHYPWVYFAITVPVGLHLLGAVGVVQGWRSRRTDPFPLLLVGTCCLFLLLFSTRVPVYDGERLFLVAFPLWSILIGRGFAALQSAWKGRPRLRAVLALAVLCQAYGVVAIHPFGLSYYNALVGGLPGAETLGLELTYWGDAVDHVLLDALAREIQPGQGIALAPTLSPGQGAFSTSRPLLQKKVVIGDEQTLSRARWLVVYRRTAYWNPEVRDLIRQGRLVAERTRQGVRLSAIYEVRRRDDKGRPGSRSALGQRITGFSELIVDGNKRSQIH